VSIQNHSHKRKNLLTGDWVLVSPHRTQRPWQGQLDKPEGAAQKPYEQGCYLCPGNERANGQRNPVYSGPFAFDNDFSALSPVSDIEVSANPLFTSQPESGVCRVVCFSEKHHLRLASMDEAEIDRALRFLWDEFTLLDHRKDIAYVQVFENRGQMMGCSNPHPHAQIWATSSLPLEVSKELNCQTEYFLQNSRSMLLDYLAAELDDGSRIVAANEHFVSLVPYWAVWPFETLLIPRRTVAGPEEMDAGELAGLASILKATLTACDNLFDTAIPYSMGFHPRPSDNKAHPEWQFHAHIYPPLLRSATIRKYQVGFEMLGMPQRDLTPETAARRLREALAGRKTNEL
jgi:UDPglucose--hexose-1-phosphate uridylyltransferase